MGDVEKASILLAQKKLEPVKKVVVKMVQAKEDLLNHISDLSSEVIEDFTDEGVDRANAILLAIHETAAGKITEVKSDE